MNWHKGFKPYYNWNTFNTDLQLIIVCTTCKVLNLIITGIPSILKHSIFTMNWHKGFKPYYNWNTFNTDLQLIIVCTTCKVLNLIITGMPSIQ